MEKTYVSRDKLLELGYKDNPNVGSDTFTYCGNCKSYTYFYTMSRPTDHPRFAREHASVCRDCNMHRVTGIVDPASKFYYEIKG